MSTTDEPGRVRSERGGRGSVVPPARIRTYYDTPVIRRPVWTWEIPVYFFAGGLAGASAVLAAAASVAGRPGLAAAARRVAGAASAVSPALLVSDLGRPDRFHHMLRVFKPTSPMNLGSWVLAVFGPASAGAAVLGELDRLPRLRGLGDAVGAALGPVMATYTAVLVSDTAVPVWHEARGDLPFVFVASAAAAAGGAVGMLVADEEAGAARRLAVLGGLAELAGTEMMRRRLGELARPYSEGQAGRWHRVASVCAAAGALLTAVTGRHRLGRVAGGALALTGSWATRWAVFEAGRQSADDPSATVGPQRARADAARIAGGAGGTQIARGPGPQAV